MDELEAAFAEWLRRYDEVVEERLTTNAELFLFPPDDLQRQREGEASIRASYISTAAPHLAAFKRDNSTKSPDELSALADCLSPGGAHTPAGLVNAVREMVKDADPLLIAATVYRNWHGGKIGFQFLPRPGEVDWPDEYYVEASALLDQIRDGTGGDPRRILLENDRAFFDALPERLTVYRGAAGISSEMTGFGVCWTTRREVAEWFAWRSAEYFGSPVVMTARIKKSDVVLAKALEFEIVAMPRNPRRIECRPLPKRSPIEQEWTPETRWRGDGNVSAVRVLQPIRCAPNIKLTSRGREQKAEHFTIDGIRTFGVISHQKCGKMLPHSK